MKRGGVSVVILLLSAMGSSSQAAFDSEASRLFWQEASKDRAHAKAGFALWRERDAGQREQFQKRIQTELEQQKERSGRWWGSRKALYATDKKRFQQRKVDWEQQTLAARNAFHQEFEQRLRQREQKRRSLLR